ncbi:interferon alpha-1-like [Antechinus flavipes]|uniref:interferon alpha-1-like n=1 Tax=Antechinus flavipes TaxID=38775 RepID=UPI0022369854|nr:interferon alpha-1-like [Antechinus flavipes]
MTSWSVSVALVLLCSSTLCCLGCDLTQGLQEDFSFLNQMSTFFLLPCLKDRTNFNFPKEAVEGSQLQRENATAIVHETLQQVFTIFSLNSTPAAWSQTQLKQLLIGLDHQLDQLEQCLGQDVDREEPSLGSKNSRLGLTSYFQGIRQYLQDKEYSRCVWEIVRLEIRKIFLFMNKFTRNLRN